MPTLKSHFIFGNERLWKDQQWQSNRQTTLTLTKLALM